MKFITDIEDQASLRALIQQDLKELGVKPCKAKKNKSKQDDSIHVDVDGHCGVFGNLLCQVPSEDLEGFGPVPRFLIDATELLQQHVELEGLFRRSGSVNRQKELKLKIEEGQDLPEDAHPFDVASLIKQFFRELPEPLLTSELHDTYIRCCSLESEQTRFTCTMLVTLLLPWQHLSTLKYTMHFLQLVAQHSDYNKMDVANLAVCLAPNLLYTSTRLDKVNGSESRILQLETNVVQLLIAYADQIGVVSDSLYHRTTLMAACFVSDDELEKSDSAHNDSKNKKKKKRSGSLQGLVSNLSSSFSKWRKDGKGHNSSSMSDKSAMSFSSIDKSSIVIIGNPDVTDSVCCDYIDPLCPDATPKMMRKRKAEEEMVPFSASKKKAILQNMPQMSTLAGTPFTPMTKKGKPPEYVDTPSIQFANNSDMVFNAHTPCINTPRKNKLFSPASSTSKVKRSATIHGHVSAKSGCFSPKTPKGGVRRSVKGFFRRLSGGKEAQASPCHIMMNSSDVGSRRVNGQGLPDRVLIMQPGYAANKKKGLFRKHRKAPSSPARLITPISSVTSSLGNYVRPGQPIDTSSIKSPEAEQLVAQYCQQDDANSAQLSSGLQDKIRIQSPDSQDTCQDDVSMPRPRKRGYSADGAPVGSTSLVRGKPNTVTSGLPSPYHRRSMDTDSLDDLAATNAKKETFQSPEKPDMLDCVPGAFDTSPIPRALDAELEAEEGGEEVEEDEDMETEAVTSRSRLASHASFTSVSSICMEAADHTQLDSEHDRAFVEESFLLSDTTQLADQAGDRSLTPILTSSRNPSRSQLTDDLRLDAGSGHTSTSSLGPVPGPVTGLGQPTRLLHHQCSVDSVDSALDTDSPAQELVKCGSVPSIASYDSGVSLGGSGSGRSSTADSQHNLHKESTPNQHTPPTESSELTTGSSCGTQSDKASKLPRASILNLQEAQKVSSVVGQHRELPEEIAGRHRSSLRFPNSRMRRRAGASPVRIPTIFAKADSEASRYRQIAEAVCRTSEQPRTAARRANLPITTQLVRSRSVERACRQLGCNVYDNNRSVTAESSEAGTEASAGHTPMKAMPRQSLHTVEIKDCSLSLPPTDITTPQHCSRPPLKDTNSSEAIAATPKIKPALLMTDVSKKVLARSLASAVSGTDNNSTKCRSPVKPVKRLQGSPRSPRSPKSPRSFCVKSPKRVQASPDSNKPASPIPGHVRDWSV